MSLTVEEEEELLRLLEAEAAEREAERAAYRVAYQLDQVREVSSSLYGFVEEFWATLEPAKEFKGGWALRAMCDHLEAVTRGEIQFLMINVPPGMMKSLLVSVFWPAWEWGPKGRPDLQYLTTSYDLQKNVIRDNVKMRRLVTSPKYAALWPIRFNRDEDAKTKFSNTAGGFREGRAFAGMTGGRGDRVVVDDPHSVDGAESDEQREGAVQTFREGITDRLNDVTKSAIVIVMQRLHTDDVAGTVMDPELDMGFVVLSLPMLFEPETRCETYLFVDPRTEPNELLFPERFPPKEVARLERMKGAYAWAGQYQQRPAPRGGGLFKRTWFKPLSVLPAGIWKKVRGWDIGATEGGGDPSAGVLGATWGHGDDQCVIFMNCNTGQWAPDTFERELKLTAALDTSGTYVRLPQDPGAAGKAYVQALVKKLPGYPVSFGTQTGNKVTRATAMAAAAAAGNVYVLVTGDPVKDAWVKPFLDEMEVFPLGRHDDQVDAAADTYNELVLGAGLVTSKPIRG